MGWSCGLVGLPNVGKSTLFNALTSANAEVANFPFCTIDPNVAQVGVPDPRLDALAQLVKPQRLLPSMLRFVDIAGLVRGAHKGEGLGNQFLAHIREVDVIVQVVRGFTQREILHVNGCVDPQADLALLDLELALADLQRLERQLSRTARLKSMDPERVQSLQAALPGLSEGIPIRDQNLSEAQKKFLLNEQFITAKPMLYVLNTDESGLMAPAALAVSPVITLSAPFEAELACLPLQEQALFLKAFNRTQAALPILIQAVDQLLDRQIFFTVGVKEIRAWSIPTGSTAPCAAGHIHSDMERGFIRAEVIHYKDFIAHAGEAGAKAAGKWHLEGKTYRLEDGDIVYFRHHC